MKNIITEIKELLKMRKNTDRRTTNTNGTWIITAEVYEQIRNTIGRRKPEHGGILGSSDGQHIDYYYFDKTASRTSSSYTMDTDALNKVINRWNDNGIQMVGIIHSHPHGINRPSYGDMETAKHIIESIDVQGKFFTPIVQVSPELNGDIKIYPYTFEQTVEMKHQDIVIEENNSDKAEERRIKALDRKAANRFKRIESIFPDNLMSKKTVICVGCGGSRQFLESLARCGVGNFILWDGDKIEDTNIATQGAYISEIGKYKCDVIKDKILDINPLARVISIKRFLDHNVTDNEFASITGINNINSKNVLILGCTDNFFAQDRCAQLSLKFGVPYMAAQIFEKGMGHEVIFSYPGVTPSCPRCMLESRYQHVLSSNDNGTGFSAGAAVCVTDYLNAIKSYMALNILCYKEKKTPFYRNLDKFADRNYLMTKCSDEFTAPAFEPISDLEKQETDLSFPFLTIAIGQVPEDNCLLCGGHGDISKIKSNIEDTRHIPE